MAAKKTEIVTLAQLLPFVEEWLDQNFTVHRVWQAKDRAAAIAAVRDTVEGIATIGHTKVDGALLDSLPKAKIVSLMSVGYDAIDVAACKARGVAVTNTPDVLNNDVADLALALLIATARKIVAGDTYVRAGDWAIKGHMALATAVYGKTVGILGLGRIGKEIAKRAEAFNLKIVYGGRSKVAGVPYTYYPDVIDLAKNCDFLVVMVPGGAATRHMINAKVLEALGPRGYLINIARGSVVDEKALIVALTNKMIAGAGLDVFEDEPNVPKELFAFDTVVLQPHVGSATNETRAAMGQLMLNNLLAHFAGKPLLTPISA
ncbi:MAG TPA: 2-hydroxyacid dehydrogenase [Magnetospirillaceae bacterium]|jgi:lactate dehydrogenase-like 2-hydroxyacid dehydrogenase